MEGKKFNVQVKRLDHKGIGQVLAEFGTPELLQLDPPRSGAGGKVMRGIGRAQPDRIVFISSNPATFAEDIKHLRTIRLYVTKRVAS